MSKHSISAEGSSAISSNLGKTVMRLRKAYNLSLSELSEQSGVAKSIISAIERNETNPTLSTIWRLSQALDTTIEQVLGDELDSSLLEKVGSAGAPVLMSEDKKCQLIIIGWLKTVEWLQWYIYRAEIGGVLESEGHQLGSVENLTLLEGEVEVEVAGERYHAKAGETLRYRCDRPHIVRNVGDRPVQAIMVNIMQSPAFQ